MAIEEIYVPKKYRACDGKEFLDKDDAERWDKLVDAQNKFQSARKQYMRAILETLKTADGYPIDCSQWDDYVYIINTSSGPLMSKFNLRLYNNDTFIDTENYVKGCEYVIISNVYHDGNTYKRLQIRTNDLYAKEKNATAEYIRRCEEWLEGKREHLEALRTKRR